MKNADGASLGLTDLEAFAKAAMQGLSSSPSMIDFATREQLEWMAETFIEMADAKLAEMENKT